MPRLRGRLLHEVRVRLADGTRAEAAPQMIRCEVVGGPIALEAAELLRVGESLTLVEVGGRDGQFWAPDRLAPCGRHDPCVGKLAITERGYELDQEHRQNLLRWLVGDPKNYSIA